jgi:hypothetical protein
MSKGRLNIKKAIKHKGSLTASAKRAHAMTKKGTIPSCSASRSKPALFLMIFSSFVMLTLLLDYIELFKSIGVNLTSADYLSFVGYF